MYATEQPLKSSGPAPLSSQVHAAAVNGDRSTLQRLITAEPCLRDSEDQFGRTPLMYCVLADRLDCAETLLKAGASVNKADRSKRTALHLAAQKGNVRFMKLLLSRHANWLLKDLEEMTPLHLATRHSSHKPLSLLLKHMAPGEVDTQDRNKQTALHWSAFYNHPEHVKLLIKHDSNIGIPDSEGKIPLHWAAHSKHPNATHTVRCILDAAPTESLLNWQDYEGRTPLHFAVADGNEAVVEVLTSYEGCSVTAYDNLFRTPLHWAALLGHARIVHLLLERNKSGMIPSDSQGATPLHYGAQSNYADTVAVFLKHPSVRDEPDLEGRTAFMWAAGKGSDDVIKVMLELKRDLDINMADKYGGTALHAAALSGHVSTVRLLLEKGAMVDPLDVMKHTPLFRACEMGHRDVILTLIKGGARVDLVDTDGHSALHWAALGGNAEVCEVLMENGLGPNLQDHAGRTPLQCAAYAGYINCMALLIQHDADPNIQDKEGAGGNWATVGRRSRGGRRVRRQREKRKGKSVGLRIGTLNVGTMTGKGRELADVMERRKVDILCVQETRWKGSKARSIGAGFKLFYYGVDSKRNGVGVVLKEEFVRNVLEVKRVSDRVMSLKLEIEGVMLNVVSGYAPQVGCELEEKERFWSELDEVMESIPTGERVVIGADFNGHVGEGNTGDEEVMGKFGVKERNLEGQMVVDFAKRMDMGVVNTYFQKREEHRVTYKSGGRRTQVDYILCRRGNLKEISDCKVVVGESVARQHRMVVCRMTLMVCKKKRSEIEKKTKWWKLKKEECCEEFRKKLRQALGGQVVLPDDWETTAEVIRETGRKVLGVSSGRRKEDKETWWWNEEVQDSIQRKRLAKKKWDMDRTEENRQEYKELQRRVKREVSKAKQKAYDELYTRLDTREGEKDLYRLARQRDRDGKDVQQVRVIKERDGRVLTSEESVQRRWKEYFEELMNEENEREKRVEEVNSVEQKVDKIRKDEVRKALKRMKSGKAVGPDDIPVEVWKCLGEAAVEFLANLFNRVLESEKMPEEWRRSVLVPIFKNKGDVQSCSNYRGIKLMSHTMKVWERVVEARLRKVVEICEQQYGFMPRKSTTDAIFALRILMEKYRDGQRELHCVFVDLEKAYDRVPREELWYCMRKSGVAEKYVRVVQDMYERSRTVVRCAVGQTEEFNVEVGLHQGSALSPFLFAIVMDQLSEEVRQESPWTMMFADDIVICSESREQVEENLERWRFALERRGMKVSRSKTEYMCVNEREGSGTVRLQGEEVKKVQEFKYLGSTVQSNGECGKEVKKRVQAGWNGWRKVSGVLCDQKISARIKGKVYRTVVRPAMLYGLETVSLRKRQESELEVAELKMLRYTPLDYALLGEHQEVTQFLLEHGALSIAAIQDIAASSIQALYKGYKVRRAFKERKNLLMRHEQLRKDAAKKREEERRREAVQQLSLAGAQQPQISLVQVGSERPPLAATELSGEIKDMKPKGHKHRKSSKAHRSQSHDRTEKKTKKPKEPEHTAETPNTSQMSALNLSMTSQSADRSDTRADVCVRGVYTSEDCVARPERHSPAGSSRPGSARHTHPIHSRPRTSGRTPESKTSHPAVASPPAAADQSGSFISVPIQAGREKSRTREPRAEREKEKPARARREKERRTEREEDKCSRTEREAERFSERERERGWSKEVEKGKRTEKEKEHRRKSLRRRNQAARVIQTAWRRFRVRRCLKELLCGGDKRPEPAEATALLIQFIWERPVHMDNTHQKAISRAQSPPAKAAAKKSSVLQSIYGGAQAKRGRSVRAVSALNTHSQSQLLHDLTLKPTKQLSGMECVHLLDSLNQAKQYSYHLRPQSASSQSRTKD
ncbi:hypothetical protein QTP70_025326 [Hemibagrus guttatus]|uniref:ribonuclease H n=2 Tax=Otophysi TaxID=186626 RepID=A0AAE0Q8E4_9TELE|nr:hypothetical protein QTP70_025326 [Hemibagrus guttatus]